ncbi:MAG: ABC transporter permease [Prevotellaceae bacterium]|jgi:putative ABC transport system permease protein|nr:ABC transporter permease [Prevotellaceae bacterium]
MDFWQEIIEAIRTNKLRAFLTGFAIAWGIFMLIVLLGAGNGLKNGMESNFRYMSKNSISIRAGYATKAYNGLKEGREIFFTPQDVEFFRKNIKNVTDFSPIQQDWNDMIFAEKESAEVSIFGVETGYKNLKMLTIQEGRFLNEIDMKERRKVIVINSKTAETLFKNDTALGKFVTIFNIKFKVVGVFQNEGEVFRSQEAYIPFSTFQAIINFTGKLREIAFTPIDIETAEQSKIFTENLLKMLAVRLQFSPDDKNAVWISDRFSESAEIKKVFGGISLFIWVIGISTLFAGIIGVSNIMVISVHERTHEFGIRKAFGATPRSILTLVVAESLVITLSFGYFGILLGIIVTEIAAKIFDTIAQNSDSFTIFLNPTVDLKIVVGAFVVLIISGIIAGYIPAKKSVKIKPIEAINYK